MIAPEAGLSVSRQCALLGIGPRLHDRRPFRGKRVVGCAPENQVRN
jgi:hypothetical protein